MIHKQLDKRIEVVFTLCANTFQSVAAVERTLYAAEDAFFNCGEQAFLFDLGQQSICLTQNLLGAALG